MTEQELVLFELAGADPELRISPHCWKIRMALSHKGATARFMPWRFSDKADIAFSGHAAVPLLVDDNVPIGDSWRIANHLEKRFPDARSLADGSGSLATCAFTNGWADMTLMPAIARVILPDVYHVLHAPDQSYFRSSREAFLGISIDELATQQQENLGELKRVLTPLRGTLKRQRFLAGSAPSYADYCVFGMFMWSRCVSAIALVASDDPIHSWSERMLDLFDGLGRNAVVSSSKTGRPETPW